MSIKTRLEKLEQRQTGHESGAVEFIIIDEASGITGDLARERWRADHPHAPEPGWIEFVIVD
jgi:hypothetical protein